MSWNILYTEHAKQDLQDIRDYISGTLLAPKTAAALIQRIIREISSLAVMPLRCPVLEQGIWADKGIHILNVKNFSVLYLPDKRKNTVFIIRIVYGGRDIASLNF